MEMRQEELLVHGAATAALIYDALTFITRLFAPFSKTPKRRFVEKYSQIEEVSNKEAVCVCKSTLFCRNSSNSDISEGIWYG